MEPYELAISRARIMLKVGNAAAAIEALRDALTARPEDAVPHLMLAQALRMEKRVVGARYEAERAVAAQPLWSMAHLELAQVLILDQQYRRARASVDQAIALDPTEPFGHLLRARLMRLADRWAEAEASLDTALALAPNDPAVLGEKGYAALGRGRIDVVEAAGRALLDRDPGHADGLILLGHVQLAHGDTAEALRLALSALSTAPMDIDALYLLAAVKMKRNPIGGLWWRWNRLLVKLGQTRAIFLVVGIWVVFRWLALASRDLGLPPATQTVLTALYLGFVLYTISASVIVARMIAREIAHFRLDPDF